MNMTLADLDKWIYEAHATAREMGLSTDSVPVYIVCHAVDCMNDSDMIPCTRIAVSEDDTDRVFMHLHGDATQ